MQTANELAAEITQALTLNTQFRSIWEVCIEFVRGNQEPGLAVSGVNSAGASIANRIWQPDNIVINKILPLRNGVASRLTTAYPSMTVLPASDTTDDMLKCKASQLALRYFWNENQIKRKLKRGTQWLTDTGNYWLHEYFDEITGDVECELVTPFDGIVEPYVSDVKDAQWMGIRRYTTKDALDARFPDEMAEIAENAVSSRSIDSYRQIGPNSKPRDRIELWEVYTVDGRHLMLLGNFVLWEGKTQTKRIPIQHVRYNEISGYLQGVGMVEPCLTAQIMRNKFQTQIMANAYKMANPKIMIPVESGVEADAFAADTGEKIPFTGGHAPIPWQAQGLPQYFVELPSRLDADMGDAASQHAISQGKISGAKSGVAIDALTANDLSPLQLVQENIEEAVQDMAARVLELMKANYTEKKMMRMMDTTGKFVFIELQGTQFVEDPQIFLEAGSLFRSESADRDQKTLEMLKAGLLTPDQAKLALTVHAVSGDMVEKMEAMEHAKQLLNAVVQFKRPLEDVQPTDDLDALKQVFGGFVHSPVFYTMPLAMQDLVAGSYRSIDMAIQQKAMQAAQMAAGGPPAGAQPPPNPNAGMVASGVPNTGTDPALMQQQGAAQFEQAPQQFDPRSNAGQ